MDLAIAADLHTLTIGTTKHQLSHCISDETMHLDGEDTGRDNQSGC
jgi:hypothetical protein